jgi:heat shock protein HslJ
MKKNIIITVCVISVFIGLNACKSKQDVEIKNTATAIVGDITNTEAMLAGKHWRLVELNGKPVEKTEAFLILDKDKNTVSGNLGCNTFTGSCDLQTGNRIKLSQIATTLKMCLNNMEIEDELKKVFEIADNYNVSEKSLILNRARMAPLARFELDKQ